jgi:hypothetical protein
MAVSEAPAGWQADFELCLAEAGGLPTLVPSAALQRRLDFRCRYPLRPSADPGEAACLVVHLHIHYLDTAPVLLEALERCLPALQPFSLLVSTTSSERAAALRPCLESSAVAAAASSLDLVVTGNIGRNIGPLLVELWPRLRQAPLLLHLHGKRSPESRVGEQWLQRLLSTLVPGPAAVAAIRATFAQVPALGLLMPEAPAPLRAYMNWGNNFELASLLAAWHPPGEPLSRLAPLLFPAGMMFWCRPAALQFLADQLANQGTLPLEPLRVDGTSLHATERLVAHSCEAAALEWALISPEAPPAGLAPARFSVWTPQEEAFLQATALWVHGARRQGLEQGRQLRGLQERLEQGLVERQQLQQELRRRVEEWQGGAEERQQAAVERQCRQEELRGAQAELGRLQQELRDGQEALRSCQADLACSQEQLRSCQADLACSQEQLRSCQEQLLTSQEQLQSSQEQLLSSQGQFQSSQEQLLSSQEALAQGAEDCERLRSEVGRLQHQGAGLEREVQQLRQALAHGARERDHLQAQLQQAGEQHRGDQARLSDLEQQGEQLHQALAHRGEESVRLQQELALVNGTLARSAEQLQASQGALQDLHQEQAAIAAALSASQQRRFQLQASLRRCRAEQQSTRLALRRMGQLRRREQARLTALRGSRTWRWRRRIRQWLRRPFAAARLAKGQAEHRP